MTWAARLAPYLGDARFLLGLAVVIGIVYVPVGVVLALRGTVFEKRP